MCYLCNQLYYILSPKLKNRRYMVHIFTFVLFACCLVVYYRPVSLVLRQTYSSTIHDTSLINLDKLTDEETYRSDCFDGNLEKLFEKLPFNVKRWAAAYHRHCQLLWNKFEAIYKVETANGAITIPDKFVPKVRSWLADDKLFSEIKLQKVVQVHNFYTLEETVYNALRSKRPVSPSEQNFNSYVNQLSAQTKQFCDFCNYTRMTAADTFGRIESIHSGSGANTFKLDKWHSLFITKKHNFMDIEESEFLDWFNTSLKWFQTVNRADKEYRFPMLFWDSLPHAGASQFHPHIHGILAKQYHGALNRQHAAAKNYKKYSGHDYWQDLVEIHMCLGLAVRLGSAVAIAPLTSVKDYELLLLSNMPSVDLFRLLYYVIQTYHQMGRFCYSSGMAFPAIGEEYLRTAGESLPAFIRIGTRGDCTSMTSDVSSLELYFMSNINADPYNVVKILQETVKKNEYKNLKNLSMIDLYKRY